jgi:hypothetical protein
MKRVVLTAAALLIGAGFLATPSMAQPQIQLGIGPDGRPQVGIRDPEQERYQRREYWRQRRAEDRARAYEQGRRDSWREQRYGVYGDARYGERCRTMIIREENDWGRTVTRRVRRCG